MKHTLLASNDQCCLCVFFFLLVCHRFFSLDSFLSLACVSERWVTAFICGLFLVKKKKPVSLMYIHQRSTLIQMHTGIWSTLLLCSIHLARASTHTNTLIAVRCDLVWKLKKKPTHLCILEIQIRICQNSRWQIHSTNIRFGLLFEKHRRAQNDQTRQTKQNKSTINSLTAEAIHV